MRIVFKGKLGETEQEAVSQDLGFRAMRRELLFLFRPVASDPCWKIWDPYNPSGETWGGLASQGVRSVEVLAAIRDLDSVSIAHSGTRRRFRRNGDEIKGPSQRDAVWGSGDSATQLCAGTSKSASISFIKRNRSAILLL